MNRLQRSIRIQLVAIALGIVAPSVGAQDSVRAGVRLDFQDADLRAVITAIAEAGGLNVTYGEWPSRRVTLHLPQPVSRAEMLPLLRSVAMANGLRVIADGKLLRIESAETRDASGAVRAAGREGVQLFVYRLKHARAVRLANTLQSLYGGRATDATPSGYGLSSRPLSEQLRAAAEPVPHKAV